MLLYRSADTSRSQQVIRPRRARFDVVAVLVLALLPLALPGAWLWRAGELFGSDPAEYDQPHFRFQHELLHAGVIGFWNPCVFGGMPDLAHPARALLYPPHLAGLLLLSLETMLRATFLFHVALAGAGMFLLARLLRVGWGLAFLAALTLQWSGWTVTRMTLPNVGDSAAWIPAMLALNLWFLRRPVLRRGLVFAGAGGCMLLLFFPQITLTLVLVLGLCGMAAHVHVRAQSPQGRGARLLDRAGLPLVALAVLAAALRYPRHPYAWPANVQGAVTGLGTAGACLVALLAGLWFCWMAVRRVRMRLDTRSLLRWGVRFGLVWIFAAAIATPQLALTGELVVHSNQWALTHRVQDFFTGGQAYGCLQEFVRHSALALDKEVVNDFALGPVVWLLAVAGVAAGLQRRHRWFLLALAGAVATTIVYMGSARVLEALVRLPFFKTFAGLAYYLGFLNVFLILLAVLAAEILARRLVHRSTRAGRTARVVLALALLANLGLLGAHDLRWLHNQSPGGPSWQMPATVAEAVRQCLLPGERYNLDLREAVRTQTFHQPMFMAGMSERLPTLASVSPIRLRSYDRWLHDHNASLGVNHDDYHFGFFEPVPSPWMRALRVRWYLFPPGATVPGADGADALTQVDEVAGWHLFEDRGIAPEAWHAEEAELAGPPPVRYPSPAGWSATLEEWSLHRLIYSLTNPGRPTWMVVPQPHYPGWRAFTEAGEELAMRPAYGFLTAVRVPTGRFAVHLEYRPRSFALGWVGFLWAGWVWLAAAVAVWSGSPGSVCSAGFSRSTPFSTETSKSSADLSGSAASSDGPPEGGTTNSFPAEAGTTNVSATTKVAEAGTTNVSATTKVKGPRGQSDSEVLWRVVGPSALAGLVVVLVLAWADRLFDSVPDSLALRAVEAAAVLIFAPLVAWNVRRWRENRAVYDAWRCENEEGKHLAKPCEGHK